MTCRATRRDRVLISRGVHPALPRRRRGPTSRAGSSSTRSRSSPTATAAGTTDLAALERMLADPDRPVAGVIAAQPDFLGLLEPMPEIGRLAHAAGALFVAVIEPVSLAVLAPPGAYGADIAAGEGQPLGIAPQYGGPYLGILASTDALVRQIPGRLVGMTTDLDGKRAFVMTMRAREQDIRRDKAASNICTNQALLALAASIYLATHRPARPARRGRARARRARPSSRRRSPRSALERLHPGPYLNEFVVRVPDARTVHRRLLEAGILAGPRPGRRRARRPDPRRRPAGLRDRGDDRRPRSSPSRGALSAVLGHTRHPGGGGRDERRRRAAPADPLRARPAGPRRRQDPAPAQGRPRPDPRRCPAGACRRRCPR